MSSPSADIATFDLNSVEVSEYTYVSDTSHNVELSRSVNLSGVLTFEQWTHNNYDSFDARTTINGGSIVKWVLEEDITLTEEVWLQSHELFIIDANLIIATGGKLISSGEIDVSGGTLDVSGGVLEAAPLDKTKYRITGGDFYELFYNNFWWRSADLIVNKPFSVPKYKYGTWIYGRNRDLSMNETSVTDLMNLYQWNLGEGTSVKIFNLADFAINQWVLDISENKTNSTVETALITDTTTITHYGTTDNITSTNVKVRQELMKNSYLDKLNNCLSGSLTWGNLLKALDSAEGNLTTRYDKVNDPKNALQSGDIVTLIIMVKNDNVFTENIFLRLPFEIK